jgi:acetyl esterase/lipase
MEENLAYAQQLMQAGVATEVHVYPSANHGFDMFAPDAIVSKQLERGFRAALRKGLRGSAAASCSR